MGKQFRDVNCSRGAPMGRSSGHFLDPSAGKVRLFRVNLNSGGYDDGGAYWGLGANLWCGIDAEGRRRFIRAHTRSQACYLFDLLPSQLRIQKGTYEMRDVRYQNGDNTYQVYVAKDEVDRIRQMPWLTVVRDRPLPFGHGVEKFRLNF